MLPNISLIIPAWNEARFLPRLLDSIEQARARYAAGAQGVEVIVADNGSTDETADIARRHGCRVISVTERCIAVARNTGAAIAQADILAFADADFRLHPETFNFIDAVMQPTAFVGGGTGITMERWSLGIRLSWLMIVPLIRVMGLDGGVWFCRRSDFERVGGFNTSLRAGEDVQFLLMLKHLGRRGSPSQRFATRSTARQLRLVAPLVVNSARKFDQHGDWHMLVDISRVLIWLVFCRRKFHAYIQRYWYENR